MLYSVIKQQIAIAFLLIAATAFITIDTARADQPTLIAPNPIGLTPKAILATLNSSKTDSQAEAKEFSRDNLAELVGNNAAVYREYGVSSAAAKEQSNYRIEVFESKNQAGAFGLFNYFTRDKKLAQNNHAIGSDSAIIDGELLFWKSNYFVRLANSKGPITKSAGAIAGAISDVIVLNNAVLRPTLLDSLPKGAITHSEGYFLGPEALASEVPRAREMFNFDGDTEIVTAQYPLNNEAPPTKPGTANPTEPVHLLIGEYHTPQFATDEMERITAYLDGLPENERQNVFVKRTGNFVIAAIGLQNRDYAEQLVNSIEYPYTVKWLRNPLWPTNDPFRTQKAAEMLLSTFGLLGLIIITVIAGGTIFGTTVFLKRRKRQQQVFSDAGGMVRLNLDPFESVILGLPPKRSEE